MIPETRYPINQSIKNTKKSSKVMIYKMFICISHSQKTFVYLRSFMSSSRVCGFIDTHAFFLVRNDYSTYCSLQDNFTINVSYRIKKTRQLS